MTKPVALAADHGGYELKEAIRKHLDLSLIHICSQMPRPFSGQNTNQTSPATANTAKVHFRRSM